MPATNTPNYFDATWAPAQPVDAIPNPAVDSAMGFSPQPGDSDGMVFAKGLQSSLFRNTKEGQDLTTSYAKQKLADQLTAQLEERKLQLRQQYPQYQFEKTPWGAIVSMNPSTGQVKDTNALGGSQSDPSTPAGLAFQTYMQQQQAAGKKAAYESSPEYFQMETDKNNSGIRASNARADYEEQNAQTLPAYRQALQDAREAAADAKRNPQAKALTPQQQQALLTVSQAEVANVSPKDPMAGMLISKAMKSDPTFNDKVISLYNKKVQDYKSQQPQGLGSPGQPAPGSMGNILDLNSSPMMVQPGMLDQ